MTCRETPGKPLEKYLGREPSGDSRQWEDEVKHICGGCRFKKSKPEDVHEDLRELVTTAFELNELKTAGAVFNYPDGLTRVEWMALTALVRGKARADAMERKRREKKR